MFTKITLVLIMLHIAANQMFTRVQASKIPDADLQQVQSQLVNLREGQRAISDEFYEGQRLISKDLHKTIDGLETSILERIKDVLVNTTKTAENTKPRSCREWLQDNGTSGEYLIKPYPTSNLSFKAYCLLEKDGSKWTVILRREDGSVDFDRRWANYQRGFGNLHGEFFLGLDYIYELTQYAGQELWVELEHKNGTKGWAKYNHFRIGNAFQDYVLKSLGRYSGNAGDSLSVHIGCKWSTSEVDNDIYVANCAAEYGGGWWFNHCGYSCLTCRYKKTYQSYYSIDWRVFAEQYYKIKYAHMAIRPFEKTES